jgi:hypothetical protein
VLGWVVGQVVQHLMEAARHTEPSDSPSILLGI